MVDIETYKILYMNRHMIRSFGEDLTGKLCFQVFRCNDKPCRHCDIDELKNRNTTKIEVHFPLLEHAT